MHTKSKSRSPGAAALKITGWAYYVRSFLFGQLGAVFEFGKTDCHMLATRALDEMTGGSYVEIIAGKYHDARSAIKLIRAIGEFDENLERVGGYDTQRPSLGDFVIYSGVTGFGHWPHRVPAMALGGDRVMLPLFDKEAIGMAPMYSVGRVLRVMRIPCPKR